MPLGRNFKLGTLMFVVAFAVSAVALYGGAQLVKVEKPAPVAAASTGPAPTGPVTVDVTAKNIHFNVSEIDAAAGQQVTINFDNQDAGVPHNVSFYTNKSASQAIYTGEIITGPTTNTEQFTAPSAPGTYFFRCDVHPDQMYGTFIVK